MNASKWTTYCSFVRVLRMIECINVETLFWHRTTKVLLLDDIIPQLAWVGSSRQPTCHTNNSRAALHIDVF